MDIHKKNKDCITLIEACKVDKVDVELSTEEYGMCFEEYITCDKDGNLIVECEDMPLYRCTHCFSENSIPKNVDCLEDVECYNCGETE